MKLILTKNYYLYEDMEFYFSKKYNKLFIKGLYGIFVLFFPAENFFNNKNDKFSFLFLKKNIFFSIFKQFLNLYKILYKIFYFKLKLRGLGYRIKRLTKKLYRFFFAYNHFFYFYVPTNVIVKHKKRLLIIFSNNLSKLNDIYAHLLLLKKMDFYERNNSFLIKNKIIYIKKRK